MGRLKKISFIFNNRKWEPHERPWKYFGGNNAVSCEMEAVCLELFCYCILRGASSRCAIRTRCYGYRSVSWSSAV